MKKQYVKEIPELFDKLKELRVNLFDYDLMVKKAEKDMAVISKKIKTRLRNLKEVLTPREQKMLELRYGLDGGKMMTLEETGKHFDITRERVRWMEIKAFEKMGINLNQLK